MAILTKEQVDAYVKWLQRKDTQAFLQLALDRAIVEAPPVDPVNPSPHQGLLHSGWRMGYDAVKLRLYNLDLDLKMQKEGDKINQLKPSYGSIKGSL